MATERKTFIAVPCSGNDHAGNGTGHLFSIEDPNTQEVISFATPQEVEGQLKMGILSYQSLTSHSICPACLVGQFGVNSPEELAQRIPRFANFVKAYQIFQDSHRQ